MTDEQADLLIELLRSAANHDDRAALAEPDPSIPLADVLAEYGDDLTDHSDSALR